MIDELSSNQLDRLVYWAGNSLLKGSEEEEISFERLYLSYIFCLRTHSHRTRRDSIKPISYVTFLVELTKILESVFCSPIIVRMENQQFYLIGITL